MVSLVVASPPTRGTRLYPCIEEEDADAVLREWPEEVGDMMSSLVNDLNPLDDDDDDDIAYPKETPPKLLQAVPSKGRPLSRSASTSAILPVGRRRTPTATSGGMSARRGDEALPTVQAVKALHRSVQFANLPHRLWPVVVESAWPPSSGDMTPSPPPPITDHARLLLRPPAAVQVDDPTIVTLACPLCELRIVKTEQHDDTAWSCLYHHIQDDHHCNDLLRVVVLDNPAYILHYCYRTECWNLPTKSSSRSSRRESRIGLKTPEGPAKAPSPTSVVGVDACSSGHYHCPLCGVLCVGMDTSSGGVKMHLLGCRQAPRRKMGPSMIQIDRVDELPARVGCESGGTVTSIRSLNADTEDRTRYRSIRFCKEVTIHEFPRVVSFLEQLDSPGVAHRPPRKKYRLLYDMPPLQDHVPLDDYIDVLCSNAFNGQGLDLTRAKYTVVGSGIPGMVFGIVRGTGGYVYGINYMEAEQWSEVTHVLVGPKVHAGSLRNICHTLRQLSLTDKVIWVDCRDLLTPTDQGSVGGWTPTSILAALTCSKRTLGSSREASKRVKGSPTRSSPPVTPPNTSIVPSPPTRPSIHKTAEDDRIRRPLVLCPVVVTTSRTTFQPAPQIMTLCDADPPRDVDLSPTFQGSRRTYFDGSPLGGGGGQQRRRRSPSPECDAPIIPGVTVTPGKHRQRRRRRAVGGYREVADVMTAAPRRSTRLSRSAPPKGGLSRVVSLPTFAT